MARYPKTVGRVLEKTPVPYSHMSDDDAALFYSTMNALLVYANQRLGIIEPEKLRQRPDTPFMLYEHGGQVSEELWRNRALVDDFVRDNPADLSDEQLACARPWRHALRDMFTCVSANANRAFYMNQDRLFVVGAMQDDADSHVHNIPSLMLLTLLPFKGGIVTDGKTLHLSPRPHPWAIPMIADELRILATRPVISTAGQLLDYARDIPDTENRVSPRFQKIIDRSFELGVLV